MSGGSFLSPPPNWGWRLFTYKYANWYEKLWEMSWCVGILIKNIELHAHS
ncbi:hypothetical protein LguiB_027155 [Lonicera macranthoides]